MVAGTPDDQDDSDEQNGWFRLYPWAANDRGQRRQQRDGRRHSSRATLDHAPADDATDQLSLEEVDDAE